MKIYQIDYIIEEFYEGKENELRTKVMSYFKNNKIIEAIEKAQVIISPIYVGFRFENPIFIDDRDL